MRKFAFKDLEWWVVTIVGRIEQQFILTTKDTKSCEEKIAFLRVLRVPSRALKALVSCVPCYCTRIFLPVESSVPRTLTFLPSNFFTSS